MCLEKNKKCSGDQEGERKQCGVEKRKAFFKGAKKMQFVEKSKTPKKGCGSEERKGVRRRKTEGEGGDASERMANAWDGLEESGRFRNSKKKNDEEEEDRSRLPPETFTREWSGQRSALSACSQADKEKRPVFNVVCPGSKGKG